MQWGGKVREVAGFKPGSFCGLQAGHKFYPPSRFHSHTALLHLLLAFPASQLPATHAAVLLQQLMSKPELELTDMYRMRCEELRAELKTKGMKVLSYMFHADDLFSSYKWGKWQPQDQTESQNLDIKGNRCCPGYIKIVTDPWYLHVTSFVLWKMLFNFLSPQSPGLDQPSCIGICMDIRSELCSRGTARQLACRFHN